MTLKKQYNRRASNPIHLGFTFKGNTYSALDHTPPSQQITRQGRTKAIHRIEETLLADAQLPYRGDC